MPNLSFAKNLADLKVLLAKISVTNTLNVATLLLGISPHSISDVDIERLNYLKK
jgi:hypothetical protein